MWWDDAAPRMLLLQADEDLMDPAVGAEPLPWLPADHQLAQVRIDGRTDQGDPVSLTGEVLPHGGDLNGEVVRLSAEPEGWTHYRGGPVSRGGALVGVVHTVWPNRLVFLLTDALMEQPGFRAALEGSARAQDTGTAVCLAVLPGADGVVPIGSSATAETHTMLAELMAGTGVTGRLTGGEGDAPLLVTFAAPGAHAKAGRLLLELPGAMTRYGFRRMDGMHPRSAWPWEVTRTRAADWCGTPRSRTCWGGGCARGRSSSLSPTACTRNSVTCSARRPGSPCTGWAAPTRAGCVPTTMRRPGCSGRC